MLEGNPAYQFHQLRDAARLTDGRIVAADGGSGELRFYSATGEFLRAVGGKGEGPGEFQSILWIERLDSDTLVVYDDRLSRVSLLAVDGTFARSYQLRPGDTEGRMLGLGSFADGSVLAWGRGTIQTRQSVGSLSRPQMTYFHVSDDGQVVDTIGQLPGSERFVRADEQLVAVVTRGFGKTSRTAVGRDVFAFGSTDAYEVELRDTSGTLQRLVRKDHTIRPVTDADVEAYKRRQLESVDASFRNPYEQMLADMPFAETMPAHGALIIDRVGYLWVAEYRAPDDTIPRWTVFTPEGNMLGVVTTPPQLDVYEIGPDYLLGRWRDELEVEYLRVYELTGRSEGA